MSTTLKIVSGIIGSLFLIMVLSYVTAYNLGNRSEKRVEASWKNNENILAQYSQKVQEAAQIPAMQRDDVAKILTEGLNARYGADGSKSAFQWIKEQNPNVDNAVYVKLQQVIEAGRNEFKSAQTELIDSKRAYKTALGSFWIGKWLSIAGYPMVTLSDFKEITNNYASKAFETGVEEGPIRLRR